MRFSSYPFLLGALACTSLAQTCSQAPTNFQIYENTTGNYGALGGPCRSAYCGVFFSVSAEEATTYYNLNAKGQLLINSATSGPDDNPNRPAGFKAFTFNSPPKAVEFGSPHFLQSREDTLKLITCVIVDSSDGDGTCDLVCTARGQGGTTGSSVLTKNHDQWYIGKGGNQPIKIKVVF